MLDMAVQQTTHHRCAVALMAQVPAPAIDDARIPPLTPSEATVLKHCFLRDLAANISVLVDAGRAEAVVVFTPRRTESLLRELVPKNFKLFPQRGETPGEVLSNAVEDLLSKGFPAVCLVNSDGPTVPRAILDVAIESLARPGDSVVLGALDRGGYYLIGLKEGHRDLFERVSSNTANIVSHTTARAAAKGLKVEMLPPWYEVKDARGLNRLCKDLLGPDSRVRAHTAPYTTQYLAKLIETYGAEHLSPDLARLS
jgi:glycosyltransferase A (GT-A) superfamily protein (DUF2064 family)